MINKRKLFIGCSREARSVADWIVSKINSKHINVDIHIWDRKIIWKNAKSTLESLIKVTEEFYYSIFILHPDDFITLKGKDYWVTRDNVVFEAGLFFSKFGGERTFILKPLLSSHPKTNEFRVLNDLDGLEFTTYKLQFNNISNSWNVDLLDKFTDENINSLCEDISKKEAELNIPIRRSHNEISRMYNLIEADLKKKDENNEFYLNAFTKNFDSLIRFKAIQISKPVQHILNDIIISINKLDDVLDISQLATEQSKIKNNKLKKVWVFAEEPLEFKSFPNGHPLRDHFIKLRKTIIDNLKAKVNYVYFVNNDFNLENLNALVGDEIQLLKYIEVIKCDEKHFLTFFTLHFEEHHTDPSEIFVSFIDKHRDDLLIKIPNPKQITAIFENLKKIKGNSDLSKAYKVFDRSHS